MLEFYFRFRFQPNRRNRCITLHQPAKFHRNRATRCGAMACCRSSRRQQRWRNATSGFALGDVALYQQTNCRRDKSIHGRDRTTSGLQKLASAILKVYFLFQYRS